MTDESESEGKNMNVTRERARQVNGRVGVGIFAKLDQLIVI